MNRMPAARATGRVRNQGLQRLLLPCLAALFLAVLWGDHAEARPAERHNEPVADSDAVVHVDHARFTILTSRLIRMEYSPRGEFEDRASLVFLHRRLPVPDFTTSEGDGWTLIKTDDLTLHYRAGQEPFSAQNLRIDVSTSRGTTTWVPGMPASGNLKGTIRTLDGIEGETPLQDGLLSRDGWTLVDDSRRPLLDDSPWPWVVARPEEECQDWYFFGYGRQYRDQLADFIRVAGPIPMPPRFAFGLWWSRYWAYTDREFQQLVREFQIHSVPLDVLVIDMDWHQTFDMRWDKKTLDQAGERLGWTGYTWDSTYFPDPEGFLGWCDTQGLRTPLNLHPASGIQPHEVQYPEMAQAMGIDPKTKVYVPFTITDKTFAKHYLDLVIHPLERQGVDFWWLDWQQWNTTPIPGVTPTWWLNYVFFTDMERHSGNRPLLFHRWGGLGNHRYQIGFSGDAISVWKSLAFQPYFTATAANVGFGYWSHDIGGHMPGPVSGELYLRWIQFGVFSPILRTHTTKNPDAERRIWAYPHDEFLLMRDAVLLRYALLPYIYTASRQAYETGVSICHPMYYDHPYEEEAYKATHQYMFGNAMLVAPVTGPVHEGSRLAEQQIWLPEGEWIEWFTGSRLTGPVRVTRSFALDEIPVYVRPGAIIPMQPPMKAGEGPVDTLILTVFPGDSGSVVMYEDQGNSLGYQYGHCSWTTVRQTMTQPEELTLEIFPAEGGFQGMLTSRSYRVVLEGTLPPERVLLQGTETSWMYDGDALRVMIPVPEQPIRAAVHLQVLWRSGISTADSLTRGFRGALAGLRRIVPRLDRYWPREWSPPSVVHALQTGTRITLRPDSATAELEAFWKELDRVRADIRRMRMPESDQVQILWHLDRIR